MSVSELIWRLHLNGDECDFARRSLRDPGTGRRPRLSERGERWRSTSGGGASPRALLAQSEGSAMGAARGALSAPGVLTGQVPAWTFRRWGAVTTGEAAWAFRRWGAVTT